MCLKKKNTHKVLLPRPCSPLGGWRGAGGGVLLRAGLLVLLLVRPPLLGTKITQLLGEKCEYMASAVNFRYISNVILLDLSILFKLVMTSPFNHNDMIVDYLDIIGNFL